MSAEGTIAIWDTYQQQANPLVVLKDGAWEDLTIDGLRELVTTNQPKEGESTE